MKVVDSTVKKAELLKNGKVYIPHHVRLPYPLDRSTAGPVSGSLSIALTFDNKNVKLIRSQNQNESFSLQKEKNKFKITKDGETFLEDVIVIPTPLHAPGQVFLNLDDRCIYNCAFCGLTEQCFLGKYSKEKFIRIILKSLERSSIQSIALTSGVFPDNAEVIKKMCCIIRGVKRVNPSVSVGVEPCIFKREEILSLKEAGADEIKINLQVPDRDLFKKVCPDFDYDGVLDMLHEAVEVFGRGKVASNIIYGLGESDVTIVNILEKLAKIGVVPTLRKIRINMLNQGKLEKAISNKPDEVSVDRILKIAYRHRKVLEKYHLTTTTFDTMCHRCGCCDIVPFWDI